MKGYSPSSYGDSFAGVDFEETFAFLPELDVMVEVLAEHSHSGPVLELGIGTGRVARPLAMRGIPVHGIEISPVMVDKLRASSMHLPITVTQGSFENVPVSERYPLVFCIWNTFYSLTTADAQTASLRHVAQALTPNGTFVMEAFVPDPRRFKDDQDIRIREITTDSVSLQISRHDPARQIIESQHVVIRTDGNRLYPLVIRYAYPEEIDRMALAAGLCLGERWANWSREPFRPDSPKHVSVYRRVGSGS
jgi:SAM-dependent methyltransferase